MHNLCFPPGATLVCLIRHGETDWNATGRLQGREDIALNDAGLAQARELARYFGTGEWDVIYSSPLQRAFETARIIAGQLGLPEIFREEDLQERDYGAASGLLPEERRLRFHDGIIPGQEDFELLRNRAMKVLNRIARHHKGHRILVVAHGALTNAMLYSLSAGAYGSFKTRLKNGCVNLFMNDQNSWSVVFYNKTVEELV